LHLPSLVDGKLDRIRGIQVHNPVCGEVLGHAPFSTEIRRFDWPKRPPLPIATAMVQLAPDSSERELPEIGFEPVLNSEEAAALLQIHPKTLQRMARQGAVPAFRIGDLWRFRASALDEWLRSVVSSKGHSCR